MFEVFPRSENKRIEDTTWIPRVCEWGWIILAKDAFRKRHEEAVLRECKARVFSLPNANMTADAMLARILGHHDGIFRLCQREGFFHYSMSGDRLRPVRLR